MRYAVTAKVLGVLLMFFSFSMLTPIRLLGSMVIMKRCHFSPHSCVPLV